MQESRIYPYHVEKSTRSSMNIRRLTEDFNVFPRNLTTSTSNR